MGYLGLEPRTYRLKAEYSTIELATPAPFAQGPHILVCILWPPFKKPHLPERSSGNLDVVQVGAVLEV